MIRKVLTLLILTLFLIPSKSFSQTEEDKIRSIIKSFNADISKLDSKGSAMADELISYVNPNFKYERKVINIFNIVSQENMDFKMISFVLKEMRSTNVTSKRTLGNLDEVYARKNLAFARYSSSYELHESDRIINKGNQYVELIFKKNPSGEWKIELMNVMSIDDLTYKSLCICEIYENKGLDNIITETIVPDGSEADIVEDKFSIDESLQPRAVRHGFRDYLWDSGGAIHKRNVDGSQGDFVGKAANRQDLLLTLIKKEVYPDRCDNVVRKLK